MLSVSVWGASCPSPARAESGGAYEFLEKGAKEVGESNHTNGVAYLVSGGLALGISVPAYYLSTDVFAKAVYSVTETLSVAAVGYGSYLLLVDDDVQRFVRIVKETPGLSVFQRNQLAYSYLKENADRARNLRRIRVISHGLTAALNLVNGATSFNNDLAMALYFLGGVNTLAAISFALGKSEEEKVLEELTEAHQRSSRHASMEFFLGPVSGVTFHF